MRIGDTLEMATKRKSGSIKDSAIVFGVYRYEKADKYWECVPVPMEGQGGPPLYRVRWWSGATPILDDSRFISAVLVSKEEAVRRIESVLRGGYTLHSEEVRESMTSLLDWMLD